MRNLPELFFAAIAISCHLNLGGILWVSILCTYNFLFLFSLTVSLIIILPTIRSVVITIRLLAFASLLPRIVLLQEVLAQTFLGLLRREQGFELTNGFPYLWFVGCVVEEGPAENTAEFF